VSAGSADVGAAVQIVVNQTPFYAESGGQVGDQGLIRTDTGLARVSDTKKVAGVFIHIAEVTEGTVLRGQPAKLEVAHARRGAIRANHSATHLLHEALRRALGDHVAQRGSLNAPDRLRFDFSHGKAVTIEEMRQVDAEVNAMIRQNSAVETRIMTPDDARALGAQALFGEKYGDEVRVVSMGRMSGSGKGADGATYSLELCGGTHVRQTGDIGAFVLLGDSASSAGVRRIEALTGQAALDHLAGRERLLAEVAAVLKTPMSDTVERVRALVAERRALENEVAQLRRELAMGGPKAAGDEVVREAQGIAVKARKLAGVSGKELPPIIDEMRGNGWSGVSVLATEADGKVAVAVGVSDDIITRVSAVDVLRAVVAALGGKGGGGRPDLAQGGAPSLANWDAALDAALAVVDAAAVGATS
jgi:alanyl-tRNA synthetase